ncbi:MAG: DUF721 domain-containing protein [Stigonema ocellatum SAG 48.90 = DSM 106950]|nr:DUF721 domain-containing protein [Stigonema ocellatum SAG 48.90 = DSM 106950]
MSFKSVNDILGVLEVQAKLQEQPFQSLLKCWPEVVGAVVAAHTQPLSIQRDVLRVATSSAAWAQNLTFERQHLLLKLNKKLPTPLVDIRFSTAGWQRPKDKAPEQQTLLSRQHPSYLGDGMKVGGDVTPTTRNVNTVFRHWAMTVQARSHGLPVCPQCHCPTPPGELQRWRVCSLCAAKQSSSNKSGE